MGAGRTEGPGLRTSRPSATKRSCAHALGRRFAQAQRVSREAWSPIFLRFLFKEAWHPGNYACPHARFKSIGSDMPYNLNTEVRHVCKYPARVMYIGGHGFQDPSTVGMFHT